MAWSSQLPLTPLYLMSLISSRNLNKNQRNLACSSRLPRTRLTPSQTFPFFLIEIQLRINLFWIGPTTPESGYASTGGWTFCNFVDFQLFIGKGREKEKGKGMAWSSHLSPTRIPRSPSFPQLSSPEPSCEVHGC